MTSTTVAAAPPANTRAGPVPRSVWLHGLDPAAYPAVRARLNEVMDNLSEATRLTMTDTEVRVHIVPRDQDLTELPPWTHLRGRQVSDAVLGPPPALRTYDQVRGLGPAVCTDGPLDVGIGEEQVVSFENGAYGSPGHEDLGRNLVHEVGHAVECGLTSAQRGVLAEIYTAARQRHPTSIVGFYPGYSISNLREYFAEGTAAWFEAGGHPSYRRAWLQENDPDLYGLLAAVYTVPDPVLQCDGERATVSMSPDGELTGTAGRDVIVGSSGADLINGGGGDDTICAGDGDDVVYGGYGDDHVRAGPGQDVSHGGVGNDDLADVEGADRLVGGGGADLLDTKDDDTGTTDVVDGAGSSATCSYDPHDEAIGCPSGEPTGNP